MVLSIFTLHLVIGVANTFPISSTGIPSTLLVSSRNDSHLPPRIQSCVRSDMLSHSTKGVSSSKPTCGMSPPQKRRSSGCRTRVTLTLKTSTVVSQRGSFLSAVKNRDARGSRSKTWRGSIRNPALPPPTSKRYVPEIYVSI